jgi:hypothetical protein
MVYETDSYGDETLRAGRSARNFRGHYAGRGAVAQLRMIRRSVAAALLGGVAVGVAGCGLSAMTSGIGGGVFGGNAPSANPAGGVSEAQLLTAAKSEETVTGSTVASIVGGGCPRFVVQPRDHTLTIFEPGRVGDALSVMHRGEITKTARECEVSPGRVTVKYGFSGRVLMGPKGRAGNVSLPVNVFVTDAKRERLTSERLSVEAPIAVEKPIGYFSIVRTLTFNIPEGTRPGEFEVFVGFERNVPNAG